MASRIVASVLGLIGLAAPVGVAAFFILRDRELASDLLGRIISFRKTKPGYIAASFLLLPDSIVAAMAISLAFGRPVSQFAVKQESLFAGIYPAWFMLILAPLLE